jgi:Tc toxin complex TcA C-terminal TcB-binding domain/Cys/Met metabolism PLP-dependent enzyme
MRSACITTSTGPACWFLQLQQTGYAEIDIPEWMYDLDYPGHYLRRIKNVSLTIPAVVGPYTGVHCRLTLLSSQTRIDPRLVESLIEHRRSNEGPSSPVPDDLLRISCGIEDPADLIADLDAALDAAARSPAPRSGAGKEAAP